MDRLRHIGCLFVTLFACILSPSASAHPALGTVVSVDITRDGQEARINVYVTHDALAYALNDTSVRVTDSQMYALLEGPIEELEATLRDGRERFVGGYTILADGVPLQINLYRSPDLGTIKQWKKDNPSLRLPLKLAFEFDAIIPTGTVYITLRTPSVLGELILGISRTGVEPIYFPLAAGETSPNLDVSMLWPKASPDQSTNENTHPQAVHDSYSHLSIAWRYIKIGYRHIIPDGYDHALFILGLFLLNTKLKDLLKQTTAFTVAHTSSFTLATFHLVSLPMGIVEPIIAATIVFIAFENIFAKEAHPWRLLIAFFFGLVHGLGFASGLLSIGLPTSQLLNGLISFNIGVELGHLTILAVAFLTIGWLREKVWYRSRVSIPLSILIALIATVWFIERL